MVIFFTELRVISRGEKSFGFSCHLDGNKGEKPDSLEMCVKWPCACTYISYLPEICSTCHFSWKRNSVSAHSIKLVSADSQRTENEL